MSSSVRRQASEAVLTLDNVELRFPVGSDWLGRPNRFAHALNGVSLQVDRGVTVGIVGESGCGKTTLAQLLMGLLAPTSGHVRTGKANVQIVFQDPQSSLNPRLPVWKVIMEPVIVREGGRAAQLQAKAAQLARKVGLRGEHLFRYPHEFSGGQRQRIAIARALSSDPDAIVLDEPTSALDISVQAQILNLLGELQKQYGLAFVLISHNVSVLRHLSQTVAVMYLGQIVEIGPTPTVFSSPRHPYTRLLLESVPRLGEVFPAAEPALNTELPSNRRLPSGCFFRDRCPFVTIGCDRAQALVACHEDAPEHAVRCHVMR